MKQLEGKVALVTGGTSGIGQTKTIAFAPSLAKAIVVNRYRSWFLGNGTTNS